MYKSRGLFWISQLFGVASYSSAELFEGSLYEMLWVFQNHTIWHMYSKSPTLRMVVYFRD